MIITFVYNVVVILVFETKILNSDFNHDYNLVIITFAFNMIIIYVMTDSSWL